MNSIVSQRLAAKIEATACPDAVASPASVERVDASIERLQEIKAERDKKKKPRKSLADLAREAALPIPAVAPAAAAPASGPVDSDPPADPEGSGGDLGDLFGEAAPPAAARSDAGDDEFLRQLISGEEA